MTNSSSSGGIGVHCSCRDADALLLRVVPPPPLAPLRAVAPRLLEPLRCTRTISSDWASCAGRKARQPSGASSETGLALRRKPTNSRPSIVPPVSASTAAKSLSMTSGGTLSPSSGSTARNSSSSSVPSPDASKTAKTSRSAASDCCASPAGTLNAARSTLRTSSTGMPACCMRSHASPALRR